MSRATRCLLLLTIVLVGNLALLVRPADSQLLLGDVLPGTKKLTMDGEIDRQLIAGVSKFLDNKTIEYAIARQKSVWQFDPERRGEVLNGYRDALRYAIGMRDARPEKIEMELLATTDQPAVVANCKQFEVLAVRWRAFGEVFAEGLMLRPNSRVLARVVVIPDPSQTPEQLVGLTEGVPESSRVAAFLASNGCQVLIPTIISRERNQFQWSGRRADVTNREFLYRSAFEMGRHLIGYEVNKVLAGVDWFAVQDADVPIGVVGWGDGALLGLYAAALDDRIDVTCLSGFFEPMELDSQKPIDRNVCLDCSNDLGPRNSLRWSRHGHCWWKRVRGRS